MSSRRLAGRRGRDPPGAGSYLQAPELIDKLFADRISRGDELLAAGRRLEATEVYAADVAGRRDPIASASARRG